jgi:hypothetical protein
VASCWPVANEVLWGLTSSDLAQSKLVALGLELDAEGHGGGLDLVGGQLEAIVGGGVFLTDGLFSLGEGLALGGEQHDANLTDQLFLIGIGQSDGDEELVGGLEEGGGLRRKRGSAGTHAVGTAGQPEGSEGAETQ